MAAWELLVHHQPDSPAGILQAERDALLDWLHMRNQSILAHGFRPIAETDWLGTMEWVNTRLLPMLLQETAGLQSVRYRPSCRSGRRRTEDLAHGLAPST